MSNELPSNTDDWSPRDDAAWEEFKRRMDSQPYLEFYPRAEDLRVGEYRGFGVSMTLWARHVLFTLPLDILTVLWTGVKGLGMGVAGLGAGIAAFLVSPFMMIFHRIMLTVGAVAGRLRIVPHNRSIALHLNHRLHTIRKQMESEGYNLDRFFHEVDAEELTEETREHLLRRWRA
jgi:hypothetical protein